MADSFPSEFAGLERLAQRSGHWPCAVEPLPGDVGRRRYFRLILEGRPSVIGVAYPPEEADSQRRWNTARQMLHERLRVPVLIADDETGNQIIEDFGRRDLAGLLQEESAPRGQWLGRAAEAGAALAGLGDPGLNPPFDAALFGRELDLARESVFDMWLSAPLSAKDRQRHDEWARALAREVSEHPSALCHRDFHANNLFPVGADVGMIDFQDLRSGPDSYDLASLLWERSSLEWMTANESRRHIQAFAARRNLDPAGFEERFARVLLQRAWKVCGTFARAVSQGRGELYRRYLPAQIALVGRLLGHGTEDRSFREVYDARLAPLC